ncbi:hypothetical protein XENTR_v10002152 [Xenopus tropicalis]|nr:hypothetical protein XENTR_v10002152 [Xenopus tropicalis]
MDVANQTIVSELVLLGLTNCKQLQMPLFALFFLVYLLTVLGNVGMALIIWISPQLHSSMYFFLFNLSFVDACFSTTISPRMLFNFFLETARISVIECAFQMYFAVSFGSTECFLLAFMAYDRYIAICSPLYYSVIMTKYHCLQLMAISYVCGFLHSIIHTAATFKHSLCWTDIHHFFCDIQPLLKLSCQKTITNEILLVIFSGSITMLCLLGTVLSYFWILNAIYKMYSSGVSVLFMYLRPNSSYKDEDLSASVFYSLVIPMLNPMIYSLRNRDVRLVLWKIFSMNEHINLGLH